jgi:uncharacterized protein (DUF2141 family)
MYPVSFDARRVRAACALALIAAPLLLAASASPGAPIEVEVRNIRSAAGTIHVDVCTEKEFLKACMLGADAPAQAGTVTVTVANVPPGRYAVEAYQDHNGNHKLDRNWIGIPSEDVGFSNDAPMHMGPPKYAAAAFDHGDTPQRLTLHLTDKFF